MANEDTEVPVIPEPEEETTEIPSSREEAVTGKAPVEDSVETLDKDSREYHVKHGK